MPKKLSLQNAKKQVVEYMIYIITMVITVALLLSFNMIIFSEEIAAIINEKSILPLILITVSVLVVLVISALVKHITVFMVRKRSREFGLYMLLGVENNDIAKMFMFENYFIYVFVLIIGVFIGTLFYQILKAVICQMYATIYYFNFEFSSKAIILTLVYMGAIFSFVSIKYLLFSSLVRALIKSADMLPALPLYTCNKKGNNNHLPLRSSLSFPFKVRFPVLAH